MSQSAPAPDAWQIIDERTVDDLVTRQGASTVVSALIGDKPTAAERAKDLSALAVLGKLGDMRDKTEEFRKWAERHGLRRLSNSLVELNRVIALPERGKAILHAQSLTRFIETAAVDDVEFLKRLIVGSR